MPLQNFVDKSPPVVSAAWLNSVDELLTNVFQGASTGPTAREALVADAVWSIEQGGTGATDAATALANLGGVSGADLSRNGLGKTLWPPNTAEITANVNVTNNYRLPGDAPSGDVKRYGAKCDGVTDDTAAFVLAATVGGEIIISGPMVLFSASLAALANPGGQGGIALQSNTKIRFVNGGSITITGNTPCNLFWTTNVSGVELIDPTITGNSNGDGTHGYLWYSKYTTALSADAGGCAVRGNGTISNFGGFYWIYFDNTAGVGNAYDGFLGEGITYVSKPGNCQAIAQTTITATSSIFGFSGSDAPLSIYTMKNCVLQNNTAYGNFVKSFSYFWSGTLDCKYLYNTLLGFGADSGILDDQGSYALAVYDHSHGAGFAPEKVLIAGNKINGVRDAGVYMASAGIIDVFHNRCTGQTSTANGTLPKGGFVFNDCQTVHSANNTADSCVFGMEIVQLSDGAAFHQDSDFVAQNTPTGGYGLIIASSGGNGNELRVVNYKGYAAGGATNTRGIFVNVTATNGFNNLTIDGYDVTGFSYGIQVFAPDSSVPALGNVTFRRGKSRRILLNNLVLPNNCTNAGQRITIEEIEIRDMVSGATGLVLSNAVNVRVNNVDFFDKPADSQYCLYTDGMVGTIQGIRFTKCDSAHLIAPGANRIGIDTPVTTGLTGDRIQNISPTELGSATAKYQIEGWDWDQPNAKWNQSRTLTGN